MTPGTSVRPSSVVETVMGSEWALSGMTECGLCAPVGEGEDNGEELIECPVATTHEGDAEEFGSLKPKTLPTPYTPSKQERLEHELTHVPFRSWCPHCVGGKAVAMGHYGRRSEVEDERRIPVIGLDYAFLQKSDNQDDGEKVEIGEVTTLVMKDQRSRCVFPVPVPQKGVDPEEYSVRQVLKVLDYVGYSEVALKCDQEPALAKVIDSVKIHRGAGTQTNVENSAVGDSQGNGLVERANRSVEGQVRTMLSALEEKLGQKIKGDDSVFPWLILHAGTLLNRFSVGSDGKTPHERLRGRKSKRQVLEFGESVHFLPLDIKERPNSDPRFQDGIWLGIRLGSEEYLIGTPSGVFKARSIRRKPLESRWDHSQVSAIMGTPWKPYNFTEDDKLRVSMPVIPDPTEVTERAVPEDPAPKRIRIERRDLERLGYTPGCQGCYSAKHRKQHRSHTDHCRVRISQAMSEDPLLRRRVEAAEERENRWIAAQYEKQEEELQRKSAEGEPDNPQPITVQVEVSQDASGDHEPLVIDVEVPGGDTNEFFMDVNQDLVDEISSQMMEEIDSIVEDDQVLLNVGSAINSAMMKVLKTHRPIEIPAVNHSLNALRAGALMGSPHVAEVYSPPRVCAVAERFGLRPGFSLDLSVLDSDGRPWDFNCEDKRKRALKLLREQEPDLLIGSPMCRAFSALQGLNKARMGAAKFEAMMEHGRKHMEFATMLYREQAKAGRYYLHEHPASASSWHEPSILELQQDFGGMVAIAHMCQFGMMSEDMYGEGLVKKPTKFLTNAPELLKWLERKCGGDHRHVTLIGGRAKACEVYPTVLCEAIVQGLRDQLLHDGRLMEDGTLNVAHHDEDKRVRWDEYVDDISGKPLRTDLIKKARQEEMDTFNQFPVYTKVPIEDAYFFTGKGPIGTRWVDVNKGDEDDPEYRCRLVAKELKKKNEDTIFAATPPLEGKKLLFSLATTGTKGSNDPLKLLFIDVKRAYFYAKSCRPVFVQLPDEDFTEGQCGRLERSMYGTRDAAANWEAEYTNGLIKDGFVAGIASPCTFYSPELDVRCVVHGDDFTFLGTDSSLDIVQAAMQKRYEVKVRGRMGPGAKDDKSIRILNRILQWTNEGLVYEADQRHIEIIIDELGLTDSKATLSTPGVKTNVDEDGDELLGPQQATKYRALVARANFVAADRPDLQFAVKELARDMANPKLSSWPALLRFGKYLKRRPRCVINYHYQSATSSLHVSTDADWAGEKISRKSTSGGILQHGDHILKSWSSTQSVIALSSGESEFYAIVKGCSQALGMRALMMDLGLDVKIRLLTDATTGKAIASRRGLGKVRHIDVSNLWVQEKVKNGEVEIIKIKNDFNPADILTKHLAEMPMMQCLDSICVQFIEGRHAIAPSFTRSTMVDMNVLYMCSTGEASWGDISHGGFASNQEQMNPADPRRYWSPCSSKSCLAHVERACKLDSESWASEKPDMICNECHNWMHEKSVNHHNRQP